MYYGILAAVYGILITFQNQLSVRLSDTYGTWFSVLTVHLAGLILLTPMFLTAWGRRKAKAPWYMHTGGLIGVVTVAISIYAIAKIGLTASNIFMLLGEILASVLFDALGLFGPKRRVTFLKALAIVIMGLGCLAMFLLSGNLGIVLPLLAILAALGRGFFLVISRGVNGKLADTSGNGFATWMNYATGFGGSLLIFSLMRFPMNTPFPATNVPFYAYFAGVVGCIGIHLCNLAAPRLSSLNMAVIVFVSETGTALLIDALLGKVSIATLVGVVIVAIGMIINLLSENISDHFSENMKQNPKQ